MIECVENLLDLRNVHSVSDIKIFEPLLRLLDFLKTLCYEGAIFCFTLGIRAFLSFLGSRNRIDMQAKLIRFTLFVLTGSVMGALVMQTCSTFAAVPLERLKTGTATLGRGGKESGGTGRH